MLRSIGIGVAASLLGVMVFALAGGQGAAQPVAIPSGAKAPDPLDPVAYLAGRWVKVDQSGAAEEHWSSPRGGAMMGMFRLDRRDGSPVLFEILTITAEGDDLLLRLRHYSPRLVAKEDKDKPMTLKLSEHGERRVVFSAHEHAADLSRIVYHCPTADTLKITVEFAANDGEVRDPLEFELKREAR
ncbi:MAG: hypothetical protein KF869_15435 [Phycisphaeraceae bacterium]|nr:hypothetical protein [Phycisphaeraceae bacterium]